MDEIQEILQSLLSATQQQTTDLIDVDIMMEEVRMLYSRLQVLRTRIAGNDHEMMQERTEPKHAEAIQHTPVYESVIKQALQEDEEDKEQQQEEENTEIKNVWIHPASAIKIIAAQNEEKDIRKWIGINDKYQLISELFHNNKEAYEDVMSELNKFDSYKKATDWLNVFIHDQYHWDDDSQAVLILYNILSKFLPDT